MSTEPYPLYERTDTFDNDPNACRDHIYGTQEEYDTLLYDLDNFIETTDIDGEAYIVENLTDISNLNILASTKVSDIHVSKFVCTPQDDQSVHLVNPTGKVKRTWLKSLFRSDSSINPQYANDMHSYQTTTKIAFFTSNIIQASYLCSQPSTADFDDSLYLNFNFDGTCQAHLPSGLSLHTLLDTGSHKTLLNKRFYEANKRAFQHFSKIPFNSPQHAIKVGNGQLIRDLELLSLPLTIQGHTFEFLALITDILDDYDFVIGLESAIQLEGIYHLANSFLEFPNKTIPLFLKKMFTSHLAMIR